MSSKIPLSLYVHIPWCIQRCPYCDFNSHALKGKLAEQEYVTALLCDLEQDLIQFPECKERTLSSIFIGGGTPSLMSPKTIAALLQGIAKKLSFADDIEITMEANPGTLEANNFIAYKQAGINRISIGVQSFDDKKLTSLGRIHNADEAKRATHFAQQAMLNSFNLDLMHTLPKQTTAEALSDLKQAIALNPPHLSWYQLTIEPNTPYYSKPPSLPDEDEQWLIYQQGHHLLTQAGYVQYEISAYSKPNYQCQHNLNYWRFGDYLGIGCGAHGKISLKNGKIFRTVKIKHPRGYLNTEDKYIYQLIQVNIEELAFEYFMNRFRLQEPCPKIEFTHRTGLSLKSIKNITDILIEKNWIINTPTHWQVTEKGYLFLNEMLSYFILEH